MGVGNSPGSGVEVLLGGFIGSKERGCGLGRKVGPSLVSPDVPWTKLKL